MKNKLLTLVLAGVMVVGCSMPAFAADRIDVNGKPHYSQNGAVEEETWSWDGKNDMELNNYNGGGIISYGELTITQSGTNTITAENAGIIAINGDLTITGDGTLKVDVVEGKESETREVGGIGVRMGDLNINDTTVEVSAKGTSDRTSACALETYDGDINITDATVTATAEAKSGTAVGIIAIGGGCDVNVNITNSDVTAEGDTAAIAAAGSPKETNTVEKPELLKYQKDDEKPDTEYWAGKINLKDCRLKDANQKVLDASLTIQKRTYEGQVIGTGEGKITSEDFDKRVAKKVEITTEELGKSLHDTTKVGAPKTADTSNVLLWNMMSLICVAAIGTAMLKSRKVR